MRTLALDPSTNDLFFDGQQNLAMVEGGDEQRQTLHNRLATNLYEFFLDRNFGLDMYAILDNMPQESVVNALIAEAIMQEERVSDISEITSEWDGNTRTIVVRFRVVMDGQTLTEDLTVGGGG